VASWDTELFNGNVIPLNPGLRGGNDLPGDVPIPVPIDILLPCCLGGGIDIEPDLEDGN
jgi:hypothetical protein